MAWWPASGLMVCGQQMDLDLSREMPMLSAAVTGGTGRYQDARGYATVVPSQNPKVTVHLTS